MCTVTFVPLANNDFILCSNRDESPKRKTLPPTKHLLNGVSALFPQDAQAGGTWIGTSQLQRVACIMNGGFEPYDIKKEFEKSRGLIVTEVLTTPSLTAYFENLDLKGTAPFTLILVQFAAQLQLSEYVWDAQALYKYELPITNKIWSSRQLYAPKTAQLREQWFSGFLKQNELKQERLLDFHKNAGQGDPLTDLVMDRGVVKTTSISSFYKERNQVRFRYEEIASGEVVNSQL